MVDQEWISVKEAADLMGYNRKYFLKKFLARGCEMFPLAPQPPGERMRRRIRILKSAVVALSQKK